MTATNTDTSKYCSGCDRTLPLDDFSFKVRATGRRQSRCRDCMAATSRAHYERNTEKVKAKAAARNARIRAEHRAVVAKARADARCADCGTPHSVRPVQFTNAAGHRHRVTDATRSAASTATLHAALEAAVPLCQRCVSARHFAALRPGSHTGGPTPDMLAVDAARAAVCSASGPITSAGVIAALKAAGRDDEPQSVRSLLSRLATRGAIVRVERGTYAAPPEGDPQP